LRIKGLGLFLRLFEGVRELTGGGGLERTSGAKSPSARSEFCSATLKSGCRAGLQTRTNRIWRLGSRQYSRSRDRRYYLRMGLKPLLILPGLRHATQRVPRSCPDTCGLSLEFFRCCKADVDFVGFLPGINLRRTARMDVSAGFPPFARKKRRMGHPGTRGGLFPRSQMRDRGHPGWVVSEHPQFVVDLVVARSRL
jgi:hypothetical protein